MNSSAWVLVTGGAKRIGAFLNQEFAKSGKNIVLHYNQSETAAIALKVQLETFYTFNYRRIRNFHLFVS